MKDLPEKCCGLDVHKDIIVAYILAGPISRTTVSEIRKFSTLASGLAEHNSKWLFPYCHGKHR